jgi:2-keto-4-pentenoate hydratase/2-oxohepta-3-ene-1,7-dioic acid hydratase in catechol pathway
MRFCRIEIPSGTEYGLIEGVSGRDAVTSLFRELPLPNTRPRTSPMPPLPLAEATLLAPVVPSKIVCVGRNYRDHVAELGNDVPKEPLIFMKPPSSLLDPGGTILRPGVSQRTDYEGELGVVIGKRCHKVRADEDVRAYILGYTAVNDFTARDLQKTDGQWTRAKGCDTFCPVGPLVTDEIDPWKGVAVETRVNGAVCQQGNTRDFIFALDVVIRYISAFMTLLPGDLLATGTPSGVGPVVAGDVVEVSVEGVGILRNLIADE